MSSLGHTLRQAREAKGLTQSQVASQTRILVQIVNDIENEDFHRIAAPIYGRGFVRLYAECVDLEPQPLIREFMDIYEGRRAPTVLVRDIPTEAPTTSTSTPEPESVAVEEPVATPEPYAASTDAPETIEAPTIEPEPFSAQPATSAPPMEEAAPQEPADVPMAQNPPEEVQLVAEVPPQQTPFASIAPSSPTPFQAESEHLWDPPTTNNDVVETEPPPIVRGLDLFDQAAGIPPPSPIPVPEATEPSPGLPPQSTESPFLPPIYEDNGPSAAERFKSGISSVSHGVLRSVRKIPRSAWRKAVLVLGAVAVLAVMVLGCVKLYQMTTTAQDPCENGACEYNPPAPPRSATPLQKTSPAPQKPTIAPKPALPQTPGKIHSTGQKVTPLYID